MLRLLEDLVRDPGLTLAFISHDLSVLRRLCSPVLVLQRGEVVENRETAALFADPKAATPLPDPAQP